MCDMFLLLKWVLLLFVYFISTIKVCTITFCVKGTVKVFYGQEPPMVENLLPQNVGSIINYVQ